MRFSLPQAFMAVFLFVGSAAAADVELVGEPCRAKQILGSCLVTDRQDGRERLILLNDNEAYGCEVISIDFEKNAGEVFTAPAGAGSWTGIEVPGDRLVIGTFYDGVFMVFDLKRKKFVKVVHFPGENYVYSLVLGSDGRVYGGTYPGAKLGAVSLDNYHFEDLGAPARPNMYSRPIAQTPWGQILVDFSMTDSTTKAFDVKSKTWRDIPGLKKGQTLSGGTVWNGYFVVHDPRSGKIEAFRDESLRPVSPLPFPVPAGGFAIETALTDAKTIYLAQGTALYRYRAGEAEFKLTKVADVALRGGRFAAAAKDGTLLGFRGQSYFVLKPGQKDLVLRPIPVEAKGRPMLFLSADADGRVWTGPHFGQTLSAYETRTGRTLNTDVICDSGGEVYGVTFQDGVVYAASYAGGDITRYDPAQPWDQWNAKNPKPLGRVGPQYIRPEAGIRAGPDGKLYAGWMARYGVYGGAISITDPRTGKTEVLENPLGPQAVHAFDVDRQYLYIATHLGANGLPSQSGTPKFGMVEMASRKVVFQTPGHANHIAVEPKTGLVALTLGGQFHVFDPKTKTLVPVPVPNLPPITARVSALGDGRLLTASGTKIVLVDLAAGTFQVAAESPVGVTSPTLATDGRVYFASGTKLYRTARPVR